MTVVENRYLVGNYAPVADEVTCADLRVSGSLPEALCGRYLRNGPNPLVAPEPSTYHWFTGDGMVHGIRIRNGRAEWYRNRLRALGRGGRRVGRAGPPRSGARGHGLRVEHECDRSRRTDLRDRGGGGAPLRAHLRARHG